MAFAARPTSIRRRGSAALLCAALLAFVATPGCARPSAPPPTSAPASGPLATAPAPVPNAPVIHRVGISHERVDAGWYVIPGTVLLWADVEGADRVDFLLAPTGTEQTAARFQAARRPDTSHWSRLHATPADPVLYHLWVEAAGPGGTARSEVFSLMHEQVQPPPPPFEGIPRFPSFRWNVGPTEADQKALRDWLGRDFDAGGARVALSSRLHDVSAAEVLRFYVEELERAGWQVEPAVERGPGWTLAARKQDRAAAVGLAHGESFDSPPRRPELGYRLAIVVR